jgi:hypothetical protein
LWCRHTFSSEDLQATDLTTSTMSYKLCRS